MISYNFLDAKSSDSLNRKHPVKFEKLKVGMTVYDVGRTKMGNTTLNTVSVWSVVIQEVDLERRRVVASWNSNKPRTFHEGEVRKWREKRPMLVTTAMGAKRLPTREEKQAAKDKAAAEAAAASSAP